MERKVISRKPIKGANICTCYYSDPVPKNIAFFTTKLSKGGFIPYNPNAQQCLTCDNCKGAILKQGFLQLVK